MIPARVQEGRAPVFVLIAATIAILAFVTLLSNVGGVKALNRGNIVYQDIEGWLWATFIGSYILCRPLRGTFVSTVLSKLALISFSLYILHIQCWLSSGIESFKLQHNFPETFQSYFY